MLFKIVLVGLLLHEFNFSSAAIKVSNGKKIKFPHKSFIDSRETTAGYWNDVAQKFLEKAKSKKPITNVAKNVILFMGDGMSLPTITATRIYAGGESHQLSFEKFPYTALSKTYCLDRMVSESTSTATAYLGGVKANWYTSGLTGAVKLGDCEASLLPENQVPSIAAWSQKEDKWTGLITTTRVTHASPAGLYSHTAHKSWESDADMVKAGKNPEHCPDIAKQLIYGEVGQKLHVIMGCGRNKLLPKEITDEEGKPGSREDKKNLIEEWKSMKGKENEHFEYVWNKKQLKSLNSETNYLLGLFDNDMCKFNVDRDPEMDPTIKEMTEEAIKVLSKSPKGYFLFVEGGMIDQAHHSSMAGKALDETVQFSDAIQKAVEMTDEHETLIVVTADHAHTMSFGGYPKRGSNILGLVNNVDMFHVNRSDPIITYANGLGYRPPVNGISHDYSADTIDMNYKYPAAYKTPMETHGGDDVLIYAKGPWAHLFEGVMEQNAIPHLMAYASCVGDKSTACKDGDSSKGSTNSFAVSLSCIIITWITILLSCKNDFNIP